MSPADRELDAELRATLGAARAWLGEWLEEGVETFARLPRREASSDAERGREAAASEPRAQVDLLARVPAGPREPLEAIQERLGDCRRCPLAEGRNTIVFGDGNPDADILFIGEGPGAEEDRRGIPFVGRAGELLTRMIERGMGIPRADVYICNIVKCRPPGNREPTPQEIGACRPFLDAQIDSVAPRVIVTLGRPATSVLLGRDVAITRMRGSWQEYRGFPVMPTFHPAFVLRQYTEQNRRMVWEDLKAALARARE
jgi:DNA polymerase